METKEGMTSRSPRPSAMTNGTDTRMLLQHVSERYFTETVERISGRRVPAFVTGTDTQRDVSSEVFYLEPVAGAEARGG